MNLHLPCLVSCVKCPVLTRDDTAAAAADWVWARARTHTHKTAAAAKGANYSRGVFGLPWSSSPCVFLSLHARSPARLVLPRRLKGCARGSWEERRECLGLRAAPAPTADKLRGNMNKFPLLDFYFLAVPLASDCCLLSDGTNHQTF